MVRVSLILAALSPALAWAACEGLLLNAEPFGFGPSAAIRQIAPALRRSHPRLGFVGEGHTLDLQRSFAYDELVEIGAGADDEAVLAELRTLRARYSHFFTAIDFRYARLARAAGFTVGVYDPLFWFWREPPAEIADLDLYVVQEFAGVGPRLLAEMPNLPPRTHVVSPISPRLRGARVTRRKSHVLINLGGLANPFLPPDLARTFAITLGRLCDQATKGLFQRRHLTAKPRLVEEVPHARRYLPADVQRHLVRARLALMTPGLGSLFEASSARTPVVWLPPTNDSQGQQVELLERRRRIDERLSWDEVTGLPPVDYFAPQAEVMQEIAARMRVLIESKEAQRRFKDLLRTKITRTLALGDRLSLPKLVREMGQDGAEELAEMVEVWTTPTPLDGPSVEYEPHEKH